MVKNYSLLFLFFIAANFSYAQTAKVKATTDTTDYLIGDPIKLEIQVEVAKNFLVTPPAIKDTIAGLDVLSQSQSVNIESANNKVITFHYVLAGYDSLQVEIEPIEILVRDSSDTTKFSALSNSLSLTVSKVAIDTSKDIKDVKEPISIPLDWKVVVLWILGILILALIIYLLYKKFKKKKSEEIIEEEIVILPPDIVALSSLQNLEAKKLWQNGMVKDYHSEITEIIRKYFEGRFNFPALELSTTEVMSRLNSVNGGSKIIHLTSDFLNNADLVKFAKYKPMNEINEEMMKQAYKIVEETKSHSIQVEEMNNVQ